MMMLRAINGLPVSPSLASLWCWIDEFIDYFFIHLYVATEICKPREITAIILNGNISHVPPVA